MVNDNKESETSADSAHNLSHYLNEKSTPNNNNSSSTERQKERERKRAAIYFINIFQILATDSDDDG